MKRVFLALTLLAVLAVPASVFAVVPDPGLSTNPACIRVFPNASNTLNGTVIGNNSAPLVGTDVRLIIAAACNATVQECPCPGSNPTVQTTTTIAGGAYTFSPAMGGCCSAAISATIEADPGAITMAIYDGIGSPDSNTSLTVTGGDFVNFQAAFLTANQCSDLSDCNNFTSGSDFVVFQSQFLTQCAVCP